MERNRLGQKRTASGAAVMRSDLTNRLILAFFEEWAARGFAALSLESVAKRTGAGKAALYRRWPSKLVMAREALDLVAVDITATAEQGSLTGDVRALLTAIRRALRHPLIRRILPDLNAELVRSPEFAAMLRPFQEARRTRGEALLRRAIGRGDLSANLDIDLANDLLIAPLYWRMTVVSGVSGSVYLDRLTAALVGGLKHIADTSPGKRPNEECRTNLLLKTATPPKGN
jgi:AcrR family transcriptional regulator